MSEKNTKNNCRLKRFFIVLGVAVVVVVFIALAIYFVNSVQHANLFKDKTASQSFEDDLGTTEKSEVSKRFPDVPEDFAVKCTYLWIHKNEEEFPDEMACNIRNTDEHDKNEKNMTMENYVELCKKNGFTTVTEEKDDLFLATDSDGYEIRVVFEKKSGFQINLKAPKK